MLSEKSKGKDMAAIGVILVLLIGTVTFARHTAMTAEARRVAAKEERKQTVCPSFLSIARSARDTLIVMRNEPLCNRYVLDNLK